MKSDPSDYATAQKNSILAALPAAEYQRLAPHLQWVDFPFGKVIYDVGQLITQVYFPVRSLTSLVSMATTDTVAEFGIVGNEGIIGLPALLGGNSTSSQAIVQIADGAFEIDAAVLRAEFARGEILQKQILLYTQLVLTQTAQNVICRVHHSVELRFARWLLSIQDRLQTAELPLTHQAIAMLLGTRRATISEAVGAFQQERLIQPQRGKIIICDRAGLEHRACECYTLLFREQARLQAIATQLTAS